MKDINEEYLIRGGGEPTKTVTITKSAPYCFEYRSTEFNIRKIFFFVSDSTGDKIEVKVDVFENTYKSLVGEARIHEVEKNQWNEFEINGMDGIFEDELTIKIDRKSVV